MQREIIINDLKTRFAEEITGAVEPSSKRLYLDIKSEALVSVATYIFKTLGARFNIASGVDCRSHMEILYHFTLEGINLLISLRVTLSKRNLEVDSLAHTFAAANWIEREIHELLGIRFKGHPNLKRLLLPDEWPEGVYPLRRDYQEWDPDAIRDRGV